MLVPGDKKTLFSVHLEAHDSDVYNVGGYMTKYMAKNVQNAYFQKGERCYGFCRYKTFKALKPIPDKEIFVFV